MVWLKRYRQWVGVYGQDGISYSSEPSRYKIAVLCTGVDRKNKFVRIHNQRRILPPRNFLDNEADSSDTHGWGTAIVCFLAEMSPSAMLYVAKIAEGNQMAQSALVAIEKVELIASFIGIKLTMLLKAIRYAVHDWSVDMIVVPLGMEYHDRGISAAILEARQHNITVVAAAGNSGGNDRVAFPARMPSVIAVHATDGHGNPSLFNPSPVKARKNFSTLGESIPTISKSTNEECYMTGTAWAACTAAAILSVVIQFARKRLEMNGEDLQWLNSPEGAELLLELMSSDRGGYNYVAPWLFFSGEIDERMAHGSQAEFINTVKGQVVAAMRRSR
ncbi:hypothetical protein FHL15_006908 [Xylaria flabelliformis]|uniref:Peptidase S8/S53 domain-containing protein n=1 Tax=Xylaria flabelliformis TaxID=2512241 RepID=A0A553HWH2_9PEZI|nr:hypothetical protein FHL15_006908 [Xylaria flabelliformis]